VLCLQVLFQLFQLQLHLQYWQKDQGSDVIERLKELLELVQWPQELAALRQQARLHFRVLQVGCYGWHVAHQHDHASGDACRHWDLLHADDW
jgi:hypothetical protein